MKTAPLCSAPFGPRGLPILLLASMLSAALALGCSGDGGGGGQESTGSGGGAATDSVGAGAEDALDAADAMADRSWYSMTIWTQTSPGTPHEIELRDLTDRHDWYSFGSTHIGTAVAFSVNDQFVVPSFRIITFDFGKVVAGATADKTFAQETWGTGSYPLGNGLTPPAVEINVEGLQYKSTEAGSTGAYEITEYGNDTGQTMAGTVSGTIMQETTKETKLSVDFEAEFHFILPVKDSGQPGG